MFYLAPAIGLSTLVIFASLAGRYVPIGWLPVRLVLAAMVILAFSLEHDRLKALKHVLAVVCFGLVCGSPILGGLFVHGAYFAYNDTFTYLAHSIWLQAHAFRIAVPADELTPFTSQIAMYQAGGLRMGASYLIALIQAITGAHWSYAIYPSVMASAITACCMAAGFPLVRLTRTMSRGTRFALLALPAFALNGMTFGSVFGFAPQTLGLTFASSLAFVIGYLLRWAVTRRRAPLDVAKASIPGALLFAALTYAYSEMMPFAVLGICTSALFVMARRRGSMLYVIVLGGAFAVTALVLLNTETLRAISAIRTQANVVVGGPVNWSPSGFIAHAFGVHGGAWDAYNWAMRGTPESAAYFIGMSSMIVIVVVLLLARKAIRKRIADYSLLPAAMMLMLFGLGGLYFRYAVHAPFPTGVGQSWSQFKLSEWASPFASVFVLLALASFRKSAGRYLSAAVVCSLAVLIVTESVLWSVQLHGVYGSITQYYGTPRSVDKYLTNFRELVVSTCPSNAPIYLDLHAADVKAREALTMYLNGQPLKSDWHDDDYFNYYNALGGLSEPVAPGDCVIASKDDPKYVGVGIVSGPFRIVAGLR